MKIYSLNCYKRIVFYLAGLLLLVVFIAGAIAPFLSPGLHYSSLVPVLLYLILVVVCLYAMLQVGFAAVVDRHSVSIRSVLVNKDLPVTEIAGYTLDENFLCFIPRNNTRKMRIPVIVDGFHELHQWTVTNFADLTSREAQHQAG